MQLCGFILTKQQYDYRGKLRLCYWLKTSDGNVKVIVDDEQAVFFVEETIAAVLAQRLNDDAISFSSNTLQLKTFTQKNIVGFYFYSLRDYYSARDVARESHIKLYEDDIRHCERFLMERFIRGGCWVTGDIRQQKNYIEVTNARMTTAEYLPDLTMLSVDLECNRQGVLFSIGFYEPKFKHVVMIGEGEDTREITWVKDELSLLKAFCDIVANRDPDIFIGWNVIEFDFKLLARRADALNVKLNLGRDGTYLTAKDSKIGAVSIPGRIVVDGIDTLKNASYHFSSFSLAAVSNELLGERKLIESDNRLEQIEQQFLHDKKALAKYNLKDCELVWKIFEQEKLLPFLIARTQMTGLDLDRLGGSVAAFVNLYLPRLHRAGYIAPNLGDAPVDFSSPGGYVMESNPGLYKNVLVLDFKSLYPSIIRTFKIDPLGLVAGLADTNDAIDGFNGAKFHRKKHFLPTLIESLWQQRDLAKIHDNRMLSYAIKIIMNSFYGVLGSSGCRFYDPRLSSSITMRGHEIMQRTKCLIEEKGYAVIYGDTDSTFVALDESLDASQCEAIAEVLRDDINEFWQNELKQKFCLTSYLEIEFETYFSQFFMPTIRGLEKGSKKRYVGKDKRGELTYKGVETVRSDWTELAQQFQKQLFERLFQGVPLDTYVTEVVNNLYGGQYDERLVYRKRLGQALSEYTKNIPPHVRAAREAQLHNPELSFKRGDWVEYIVTSHGPELAQHNGCSALANAYRRFDYDHYCDKQLAPIADMLLPLFGTNFKHVVNAQGSLF